MRFWGPATVRSGAVREAAVAGRFYPGRAAALAEDVDTHLGAARRVLAERAAHGAGGPAPPDRRLVGVVAPHAGYVFSGPTAGYAYASLDPESVDRVVVLGPAHHVLLDGVGLSTAAAWRTPLGDVALDCDVADELAGTFDFVHAADHAHAPEHSLEVQVPFLQRALTGDWSLVPLIVGVAEPEELGLLVTWLSRLPRSLIVVSTDLSHYLDYESAIAQDSRTISSVVHRRAASIGVSDACGRYPLRGLLAAAATEGWTVRLLDARNSGDTAGDHNRVVGYAAFAVSGEVGPVDLRQSDRRRRSASGRDGAKAGRSGATRAETQDEGSQRGPVRADSQVKTGRPGSVPAESQPVAGPAGSVPPDGQTEAGSARSPRIGARSRALLLELARQTIEDALAAGRRRPAFEPDVWSDGDPALTELGAAFVTLRSASGALLGCIGSLTATQSLVADVAQHAYDAAFRDPRFVPMSRDRAQGMVIDVCVLSPTRPLACAGYDELLDLVPVGSGLVVEAGRHRATFLPAVWEQLPTPPEFLAALWRKAGLAERQWSPDTLIEVYDSEEFAEQ